MSENNRTEYKRELTERQKDVFSLIEMNPKISLRKMEKELNIGKTSTEKHVNALKEKGALKRVGGKRGHWEVIGDGNS